uniref:Uncharacterized protein n=1 Tax=Amphilophus citrinellus TaxID=61819 RepID=A0A3Q0R9G6_AMPCI
IQDGRAGLEEMIDTFDRPGKTYAAGTYAGTEAIAHGLELESGKRLPKAKVSAAAGVGHVRAEWSIFDAEAKGPNAGAEASVGLDGARAFAKAEIASASASAGPVKANIGLGFDTGVEISPRQIEAKLLGVGFSIGCKADFTLFGIGVEFNFC